MNLQTLIERCLPLLRSLPCRFSRRSFRGIGIAFHQYLALTAGAVFVLIGITGSLNVFQPELDAWLNPRLTILQPAGAYRSVDEMLAAVKAAHPRRFGGWRLMMPQRSTDMLTAWFERPSETAGEFYAPLMVTVNPYTAEVVASRFWGDTVMTWIMELHTELFMGAFGRKLIGLTGLLLVGSLLTGLLLWWPGRRRIRSSLKLHPGGGRQRLLFDLHRLTGVSSAAVLLTVALTGFHFAYPGILEGLFKSSSSMGDIHDGLNVVSTAVPNGRPVTAEESLLLARGLYPKSPVLRILTPENAKGSYQVWFGSPGGAAGDPPAAVVCVDQYSGHILHVENLRRRPAGDAFLDFLHALHTGAALGFPGRVLWGIAGWVPLFLYVTGLQRWRRKKIAGPIA